jgi:hypothetical protein
MYHPQSIDEEPRSSSDTAVIMLDVLIVILFPMYALSNVEIHVDADAVWM